MDIVGVLVFLVVAGLCGIAAQLLTGYSHGGFLISVVIGLFGAFIGNWLSSTLGIADVLVVGGVRVVWTIVGSAIFVLVLSALRRRR